MYRDENTLVVNKPAGIVVHRSEMATDSDVAMMRARDTIGAHVWPIHRLDRQTSGALVFALSVEAARTLRTAWDDGHVQKTYLAIVRGEPPVSIHVDYAIPKGEGKERVAAITDYERLATSEYCSLVRAFPKTGRYHQLRRHCSHLRHPIANDSNYGTGWFNRKIREDTGLLRLALHASEIRLPTKNGTVHIKAPIPCDFAHALDVLGLVIREP